MNIYLCTGYDGEKVYEKLTVCKLFRLCSMYYKLNRGNWFTYRWIRIGDFLTCTSFDFDRMTAMSSLKDNSPCP